jgi:hypothetical protein
MYVFDHLSTEKRAAKATGGVERRMTEAAVMMAVAHHFIGLQHRLGQAGDVRIHPDGEHAKQFDISGHLSVMGFEKTAPTGKTKYGGIYKRKSDTITVFPKSGLGDVCATVGDREFIAECKGGTINSRHGGVLSKTRSGLSELIGQLMVLENNGSRQIAARPYTAEAERLARRLCNRCNAAGIEIALVQENGELTFISSEISDA